LRTTNLKPQVGAKNHFFFCIFVGGLFFTDLITIWLSLQFIGAGTVHQDAFTTWVWNSKSQVGQIIAQLVVIIIGCGFMLALSYIIYVQTNNLLLD
jgi:hypothetical protein